MYILVKVLQRGKTKERKKTKKERESGRGERWGEREQCL